MLWVFVAAKAPEAVARMMANPNAVLLSMVFISLRCPVRTLMTVPFGQLRASRQNIKMTEPFGHSDVMAGHVDADDLAYRSGSSADPILRITLSSLGDSERCRRTVGELF